MKKLLSMALAMCMLVTSLSLVAVAETEALTTFKSTKLMSLDTNATSTGNLTVDKDGNIETQGTISNYVNLTPFENLMFDLNATSGDQYMELNLKNGMHTLEITVSDSDNADSEFGIADILIDEK